MLIGFFQFFQGTQEELEKLRVFLVVLNGFEQNFAGGQTVETFIEIAFDNLEGVFDFAFGK